MFGQKKSKCINKTTRQVLSRRNFIKKSAAVSIAALAAGRSRIFAAGSDKIRVGLVGCGGRGTGAAMNCAEASNSVELVALADLFEDQLTKSRNKLTKLGDKMKVTDEMCFVGFDAYKKLLATDIDLVLFATPPHFRPIHLKAAIEAGKHVFMEKPVAVDPVGVRSVIATSELAGQKGLGIVAGTQRRHEAGYLEIMKRIHDGAIGEIVGGQCYWNSGTLWVDRAKKNMIGKQEYGWSDMEWQCRSWLFFTWLGGDHIVEQHIHNLDVINWAMGSHPVKVAAMGGRQVRTEPEYGNIFDHFACEYEYPNGVRVMSLCRQTDGCHNIVAEHVVGTKGSADPSYLIEGSNAYKYDGISNSPLVQEHADLIASIRSGEPLNEGKRVAESTLTAIMGRMSAYTGRAMKWDWVMKQSKLDLSPPSYEFGPLPLRPVAVPGKTQLV